MITRTDPPTQNPWAGAPGLPEIAVEENTSRAVEFLLMNFGPTTLTAIGPDNGTIRSFWLDETTCAAASDWLDAHARYGMNLYFNPNQPSWGLKKKPNKSEIFLIRCGAYADIDFKDGRTPETAWAAITTLPRAPTFVIMTGGGFQPIWKLLEAVAATAETIARVEATSERIADLTGGDQIQSIDRILRIPFTRNYPNAKKRSAGRVQSVSGLVMPGDTQW